MDRIDPRITRKMSGPSWQRLRRQFNEINDALLAVSSTARGELTTIYVKYLDDNIGPQPYAVLWLKKSTELVVGLAVPDGYCAAELRPPFSGYKYANLTAFMRISVEDVIPPEFARWASDAYEHVKSLQ